MSEMMVLTEESLGLVAGGANRCDRPPNVNAAELYTWARDCAATTGQGSTYDWMTAANRYIKDNPDKYPKQPKK